MNDCYPLVSIIIPIRNEEKFIADCLDSILNSTYPSNQYEILIIDGCSDDLTLDIINTYSAKYHNIKVFENLKFYVPHAMNIGISNAMGDYIVRIDAHAVYPNNYISKLIDAIYEYKADNVGCAIETVPANDTLVARSIAVGLSSPFGVGNSKFRVGVKEALEVDTVPFGCFRREVFDKIGRFDEELIRNQDDEFNARMISNGFRIVLIPYLTCRYRARENYRKLSKMLFQYGLFKPLVNWKLGKIATLRQLIPLFLILFIVGGALLGVFLPMTTPFYLMGVFFYLLFITIGGLKAYQVSRSLSLVPYCIITFPIMHVSYGWGYINGIWALFTRKEHQHKDIQLSR